MSNSMRRTAKYAQAVLCVHKQKQVLECLDFILIKSSIRHYRMHGYDRKHLTSNRNMPNGPALRERFRKEFEGLTYVAHVILV